MYRYKNAFNKRFQRIVCQNKSAEIYSERFQQYVMRSTSGYASIWCILLHQL